MLADIVRSRRSKDCVSVWSIICCVWTSFLRENSSCSLKQSAVLHISSSVIELLLLGIGENSCPSIFDWLAGGADVRAGYAYEFFFFACK
jgi:hypothetical protein